MRRIELVCLICLAAVVAACEKTARLYPANDEAATGGVLLGKYMAYGTGNGEIEIPMPDGELMKGEYSLVRGGEMGFGTIYAKVYAPGVTATGVGTSTVTTVPGGSPGQASLFGDKGTRMQCEFYNDNFSGHGYGACQSSNGALYRIQY